MRLKPEQLEARLAGPLPAVFLIAGDEPLLLSEAADRVRAVARDQGFADRERFAVDGGFDWEAFEFALRSPSLFSGRRLVELHLDGSKPGDRGAAFLRAYARAPLAENLLLVLAGRLDAAALRSRWVTALEGAGALLLLRRVDRRSLPGWLAGRLRAAGLRADAEALSVLAERVEGNLLAAAQEVARLALLLPPGEVDARAVRQVVADSSRYDIYDLSDACLAGQVPRVVRIARGLRECGQEPVLVNWALTRDIRLLNVLAGDMSQGLAWSAACGRHRVWERRRRLLRGALQRLPAAELRGLWRACARVDRVLKGAEPGPEWDLIADLALRMAGAPGAGGLCRA